LSATSRAPIARFLSAETSSSSSIDTHTSSISARLDSLHAAQQTASPPTSSSSYTPHDVADAHRTCKAIEKTTGSLGSVLEPHYEPHKLVTQPLSIKDVTLELLMASQCHIGHATALWNPANQRYIYGIRQGVHIISLESIAAHLRRAAKVVEGVAYHGGLILLVGTRPGQSRAVVKAAQLSKGCHLFERWIPGSITNGDQLLANCRMRVVNEVDEEVGGEVFEEKLAEYRSLKPDLVVCLNPLENYVLLRECGHHNIPTIGIVDTDADPTWVTYPIPANDDRSVQFL
jgi:small subunit ribosomal protein S2